MQGEIRVTVIATGFDRPSVSMTSERSISVDTGKGPPVLPFPAQRQQRPTVGTTRTAGTSELRRVPTPPTPLGDRTAAQDLSDMEIPTFIRRQMD
jgi:hypothetical protein